MIIEDKELDGIYTIWGILTAKLEFATEQTLQDPNLPATIVDTMQSTLARYHNYLQEHTVKWATEKAIKKTIALLRSNLEEYVDDLDFMPEAQQYIARASIKELINKLDIIAPTVTTNAMISETSTSDMALISSNRAPKRTRDEFVSSFFRETHRARMNPATGAVPAHLGRITTVALPPHIRRSRIPPSSQSTVETVSSSTAVISPPAPRV